MDDTPPRALHDAVDLLAQRMKGRLALVPAATTGCWSVLEYAAEGTATLLVPAMESGALYRHLMMRISHPA